MSLHIRCMQMASLPCGYLHVCSNHHSVWMYCDTGSFCRIFLLCEPCDASSNHYSFKCLVTLVALVGLLSCLSPGMSLQITNILNAFSHWEHLYGFSPVWIQWCFMNSLMFFGLLLIGFSSVWVLSWHFKSLVSPLMPFHVDFLDTIWGWMVLEFIVRPNWPYSHNLDKLALMCHSTCALQEIHLLTDLSFENYWSPM